MPRTGSRSMALAAQALGLRATHGAMDKKLWANWRMMSLQAKYNDCPRVKRYDWLGQFALQVYSSVAKQFPDDGFVLAVRDVESWKDSIRRHYLHRSGRKVAWNLQQETVPGYWARLGVSRMALFGTTYPDLDLWARRFLLHAQEVQDYFSNQPERLLVFNLFGGDGWKELADWLEISIPEGLVGVPLPHHDKGIPSP